MEFQHAGGEAAPTPDFGDLTVGHQDYIDITRNRLHQAGYYGIQAHIAEIAEFAALTLSADMSHGEARAVVRGSMMGVAEYLSQLYSLDGSPEDPNNLEEFIASAAAEPLRLALDSIDAITKSEHKAALVAELAFAFSWQERPDLSSFISQSEGVVAESDKELIVLGEAVAYSQLGNAEAAWNRFNSLDLSGPQWVALHNRIENNLNEAAAKGRAAS